MEVVDQVFIASQFLDDVFFVVDISLHLLALLKVLLLVAHQLLLFLLDTLHIMNGPLSVRGGLNKVSSFTFMSYRQHWVNSVLLLKEREFLRAFTNSGFISTRRFWCSSNFSFLCFFAAVIIAEMPSVSKVRSRSQIHCLSRWSQSYSSGKYLRMEGFYFAKARKSSEVRPSKWGTAERTTSVLFRYYKRLVLK